MKARVTFTAALAATMGIGTVAQARDWNQGGGHSGHGQAQHERRDHAQRSGQIRWQPNDQRNYQQNYQQRNYAQRSYTQPQYHAYQRQYAPQYRSYAYGPQYRSHYAPRYYAGGYAPTYYGARRYWVNDWRMRGYAAPPYGYQWVETDTGDVLLMALATGLIASAILAQ